MTQAQQYKAIAKAIRAYTKENTRSPEAARAALIREGIYDKHGRLKERFNEALDQDQVAA